MKKIRNGLLAAVMVLLLSAPVLATEELTITGPEEGIVGKNVMLTIEFPAGDYEKLSGKLSWDRQILLFQGYEVSSGWELSVLEDRFTLTRTQQTVAAGPWLCLTFRVANAPVGTKASVSCVGVTADEKAIFADSAFTFAVGNPLSHDNALTQLVLENGTLLPQFHPDITSYTAQADPGQTQLKLQAVPAQKATVEVNNPQLSAQTVTRVTVTVTAENGSQRVYVIDVDPVEDATQPTQIQEATQTQEATQSSTENNTQNVDLPDVQRAQFPWWAVIAAVFAGGALGGGVVILIQEGRKKNR